jgi:rhodanese-related sulfurtransferase
MPKGFKPFEFNTTLRQIGLIFLVALVLAGVVYLLRPDKMPLFASGPAVVQDAHKPGEISFPEAVSHFKDATALFADARPEDAFQAGHIKGAHSMPAQESDRWLNAFYSTTPPDTAIITYCDGEHCTLSRQLAELLIQMGYQRTYYLVDGWGRWKAAGLPVEGHTTP